MLHIRIEFCLQSSSKVSCLRIFASMIPYQEDDCSTGSAKISKARHVFPPSKINSWTFLQVSTVVCPITLVVALCMHYLPARPSSRSHMLAVLCSLLLPSFLARCTIKVCVIYWDVVCHCSLLWFVLVGKVRGTGKSFLMAIDWCVSGIRTNFKGYASTGCVVLMIPLSELISLLSL